MSEKLRAGVLDATFLILEASRVNVSICFCIVVWPVAVHRSIIIAFTVSICVLGLL